MSSKAMRHRWERILQPLLEDVFGRLARAAPQEPGAFFEARVCDRFSEILTTETRDVPSITLARLARELRVPVAWKPRSDGRLPNLALQPLVCRRLAENAFWRANQIAYLQHLASPLPQWMAELTASPWSIPEALYDPVYTLLRTCLQTARDQLEDLEDPKTPGSIERAWDVTDRMHFFEAKVRELEAAMKTFRERSAKALEIQAQPVQESTGDHMSRIFDRIQRMGLSAK